MGHVGGVEDEVKGKSPGLGPLFVLGADELLGAEGEGVVAFGGCVRDCIGFGAERRWPEKREVAEATTGNGERGYASGRKIEAMAYIPTIAIFLPGPAFARTKGLHVVMPAHSWIWLSGNK